MAIGWCRAERTFSYPIDETLRYPDIEASVQYLLASMEPRAIEEAVGKALAGHGFTVERIPDDARGESPDFKVTDDAGQSYLIEVNLGNSRTSEE